MASLYFQKPPSTKVNQTPGGNQSVNVLSAAPAPPPAVSPAAARRPSASSYAPNSPFDPNAAVPAYKPSTVVNPSASVVHPQHPFSKAPLPEHKATSKMTQTSVPNPLSPESTPSHGRTSSKANVPSQGPPITFDPAASAANVPPKPANRGKVSQESAPVDLPPSRRTPPKANNQSDPSRAPPAVSSIRVGQSPGGAQQVNVLQTPQPPAVQQRITPTVAVSAANPLSATAAAVLPDAPPKIVRVPTPKANIPSPQHPLAASPSAPPPASPSNRPPPKANIPAQQSPFSTAPDRPARRDSRITAESALNPLNPQSTSAAAPPVKSAVRTSGAVSTQTYNAFSQNFEKP